MLQPAAPQLSHVTPAPQDATFVRDSVRSSKRSNVSYMKPGPPTPGRDGNGLKLIEADQSCLNLMKLVVTYRN